jgi:FdhE protein
MPNRSIDPADPIVQRLRTLAQESSDLKEAAQVYEVILPLLRDADLHIASVPMTPEQAREKMTMGLPLLHSLDLELEIKAVHELMVQLAAAVETIGRKIRSHKLQLPCVQVSQESDVAARRIRLALKENRLDIGALLPYIAANESGPVTSASKSLQLDPGLVWTLAQNAFKPALRAWCRQLTPLAEGIPWHKGYCFVCGATATLGELQENDQAKHLRCGQCGADWLFRRLQCMYCGNEDHQTQQYLYVESQREKMQVEVCDKCHGYLKIISAFTPTPPEMLPVEDLATLHLDYIAHERGYAQVEVQ